MQTSYFDVQKAIERVMQQNSYDRIDNIDEEVQEQKKKLLKQRKLNLK